MDNDGQVMQAAARTFHPPRAASVVATHTIDASPRRGEAESFVRRAFARRFGAHVPAFAPNLMLLEAEARIVAVAGWRPAAGDALFLERYLDAPVEQAVSRIAGHTVPRARIVEVGNLAAGKLGGSLHVIAVLADHLLRQGYEWVVFTATSELIGMFARLGLPLPVVARADPARLGAAASAWGSYYEAGPIVVAGRIRFAVERFGRDAS
jgi:hypothetical protein